MLIKRKKIQGYLATEVYRLKYKLLLIPSCKEHLTWVNFLTGETKRLQKAKPIFI